jgi:hypothetical protein
MAQHLGGNGDGVAAMLLGHHLAPASSSCARMFA